jgi:hypothetical protein
LLEFKGWKKGRALLNIIKQSLIKEQQPIYLALARSSLITLFYQEKRLAPDYKINIPFLLCPVKAAAKILCFINPREPFPLLRFLSRAAGKLNFDRA